MCNLRFCDRYDSSLYYKTSFATNLALAWIVIYDFNLQTEAYLTNIIYDRKTFIVQATEDDEVKVLKLCYCSWPSLFTLVVYQ
jgi:hypothetical protein